MRNASLCANTIGLPLPIVGYEGNPKVGYFAATNRIEWGGDAGIACSLEDMIAYEIYLDKSLKDDSSLYAQSSQDQKYRDGTIASYRYGLKKYKVAGHTAIGHGGALRGFRHLRMQLLSERLSVVVMYNYETPANTAPEFIVKKILGDAEPKPETVNFTSAWKGHYLDEETQLHLAVEEGEEKPGTISFSYGPGTGAESARLISETEAQSDSTKMTLEGDILHVERTDEKRTLKAVRLQAVDKKDLGKTSSEGVVGVYRNEECDSVFTVSGERGALYGSFDGFLGRGPIWTMKQIGANQVWALGNPRGLDSTPPGDWTVVFKDEKDGKCSRVTVGCWLARNVEYVRQD